MCELIRLSKLAICQYWIKTHKRFHRTLFLNRKYKTAREVSRQAFLLQLRNSTNKHTNKQTNKQIKTSNRDDCQRSEKRKKQKKRRRQKRTIHIKKQWQKWKTSLLAATKMERGQENLYYVFIVFFFFFLLFFWERWQSCLFQGFVCLFVFLVSLGGCCVISFGRHEEALTGSRCFNCVCWVTILLTFFFF